MAMLVPTRAIDVADMVSSRFAETRFAEIRV